MACNDCQTKLNWRVVEDVLGMEQNLCWHWSINIDQISFRRGTDGWQVVVKGEKAGKAVVAFLGADTLIEALELSAEFAARGCFEWGKDRWPSKHLKQSGVLKDF